MLGGADVHSFKEAMKHAVRCLNARAFMCGTENEEKQQGGCGQMFLQVN